MTSAMTIMAAALCVAIPAFGAAARPGAEPVRALIITGQNNHNWWYTSRVHKETLEASGRFIVDIADDAPGALKDAAGLKKYGVFVLDYNGPRWGEPAEKNFLEAVQGGTGVVIIHASNNAFVGWKEYEQACALMWINGTTGHGQFHPFDVQYVDKNHAITRGLSDMKDHPDELYHKLVNTQNAKFTLLAKALSTTESGGTGQDEPMALVLNYGKGRVFHTPLGHVWKGANDQKASIGDPQFKLLLSRGAEWAATGNVTIGGQWADKRAHNTLSEAEKKDGWVLLFDGKSNSGFRAFKADTFPSSGWVVEDADGGGAIRHVKGGGGGDIVTRDQFGDFEFSIEWKVAPGGNSGIMYRVGDSGDATYSTGPEMQVLDNAAHADGKNPKTSAGALYALIECNQDVIRPAGEWNTFKIVARGPKVEHWANGWKVLEYSLSDPEWSGLLKGSKFETWKGFGREAAGHIALQDHGDDVWYRNIKVRKLR